MSDTVTLFNLSQVPAFIKSLTERGFPLRVRVMKARRSLDQNALFHMWCEEAAQFFVAMGKTHFASGAPMNKENVKANLKATFLGTEPREYIDLTTGEARIQEEVRHTADLDKGEMCAFLTCIDRWAQEYDIPLTHPADSEYAQYMREQGEVA